MVYINKTYNSQK